jgi:hypothetical protein
VVPSDANETQPRDQRDALVREGSVSDQVAGHDVPVDTLAAEMRQHHLERREIRMDIGKDA